MPRVVVLLTTVLVAIACACGSAAGVSYDPPLVTLHGTITSSSVPTHGTVHVALVWRRPPTAGSALVAVQELAVRAEFPATFHLDVRQLPPVDAMIPIDRSDVALGPTAYAIGTLLVYEDTNGNGTLDPIPAAAAASVDRVLGSPDRLTLLYLEGGGLPKNPSAPRTDEDSVEHTAGFNLIFEPAEPSDDSSCTSDACSWTRQEPSTPLTIALTGDPRLTRSLCEVSGGDGLSVAGECSPCLGEACRACPIADDAKIECRSDRSFAAISCPAQALCKDVLSCRLVMGQLDPSGEVPASWPCR